MKSVILLTLLSIGCDLGIPEPTNIEVSAPTDADLALEIVTDAWTARVGVDPRESEDITIRWFVGDCLTYSDPGLIHGYYPDPSTCQKGNFWEHDYIRDDEIHLLVKENLAKSALSHEVLHWTLHVKNHGPGDGNHESSHWHEVKDIEQTLALSGL